MAATVAQTCVIRWANTEDLDPLEELEELVAHARPLSWSMRRARHAG